jgi:hypothetical protein
MWLARRAVVDHVDHSSHLYQPGKSPNKWAKLSFFRQRTVIFFSKRALQIQLTFADPEMLIDENAKN